MDKVTNFTDVSTTLLKELQTGREGRVEWSKEQKAREAAIECEHEREAAAEECAHKLKVLELKARADGELSVSRWEELALKVKEMELKLAHEKLLAEWLALEKQA
ncbi:hypothetical protein BDN67DRAFT_1017830 [Paxillus ammoniavirescens]|nr:hypothetical protein BDN67DRAFT_1017830 [Paxillus ammoniavirescens]